MKKDEKRRPGRPRRVKGPPTPKGNPRLQAQSRKVLVKHYMSKYRAD